MKQETINWIVGALATGGGVMFIYVIKEFIKSVKDLKTVVTDLKDSYTRLNTESKNNIFFCRERHQIIDKKLSDHDVKLEEADRRLDDVEKRQEIFREKTKHL